MNFLKLLFMYLPIVITGVMAVETSLKGQAPGATKKKIIIDAILAGALIGETVPEAHVAVISTLIDTVVSTLNKTGVFTKAETPPK